ncbi:MAG: hypothetical protein AD073_000119 [Mycoplasmataceae bacterium]|nr:MAG: hypothetical protein AD073_000119 [Mycoplasmataceae bacterium]
MNKRDDFENLREDSYWEQIFNLITANANIISMFIFTLSFFADLIFQIKLIPVSKKDKYFYWSYTTIWHILSPILGLIYFSKVDFSLIEKFREEALFDSFFHPLFYFLFVVVRAANCIDKKKYPYQFFWIPMNNYSNFFMNIFSQFSFLFSFYLIFYLSSSLILKLNRVMKSKIVIKDNIVKQL